MKNIILFVVLIFASLSLSAQSPSYVDWEWDIIQTGYVIPSGDGVTGGIQFGTEVRYNATDEVSVGFSWHGAAFGSDFNTGAEIGVSGASLIVGDYYLKKDSGTRAFGGLGLGLYTAGTTTVGGNTIEGGSSFGLAPRIGYELGHVRAMAQYNLAFSNETSNYISITLGVTLWGGYKG